jgi:hypothetical protein
MEITVRIPDDLARRLGTAGEVERHALEALALEEYKLGHLSQTEVRQLLGFETSEALDGFLKAHEAHGDDDQGPDAGETTPDEARRAKARQAAANIIARRKGVTLGGLKIKDLINEGRP